MMRRSGGACRRFNKLTFPQRITREAMKLMEPKQSFANNP
jgi:hypothetical protein